MGAISCGIQLYGDTMHYEKPLSPHLQIYQLQLTSALSIFHRVSGFALGLGALHFLWFLGVLAYGAEQGQDGQNYFQYCVETFQNYTQWLIVPTFVYHSLNGMRHLIWDIGIGLSIKWVYRTGWSVVVLTVILLFLIYGVL